MRESRSPWFWTLFFSALVLCSTGLTYMWVWRIPFWLFLGLSGMFFLFLSPQGQVALHAVIASSKTRIMLPWVLFLVVIVMRDGFSGILSVSITDRVMLNAASLILFVTCAAFTVICGWRQVMTVVGVIAGLFGAIAIGQYFGSYDLWTLPDTLSGFSSRNMALDQAIMAAVSAEEIQAGFDRVGRVRALDIYVHKFAAYQGIMVSMVIAVAITPWWSKLRHRSAAVIATLCALVASIGLVLTFSRAPLFGLMFALLIVLWLTRRQRSYLPLIGIGLFGIVIVAASSILGLAEANQFGRIFDISPNSQTEVGRIQTWIYSVRMFFGNPIFGGSSTSISGAELVTHNVPLRVLGDFGIVGFTFYFAVWWGLLSIARQTLRIPTFECTLAGLVMISALIVAFLDNLTHSSGLLQRDTSQAAIFGVGYGLCLTAQRQAALLSAPRRAV